MTAHAPPPIWALSLVRGFFRARASQPSSLERETLARELAWLVVRVEEDAFVRAGYEVVRRAKNIRESCLAAGTNGANDASYALGLLVGAGILSGELGATSFGYQLRDAAGSYFPRAVAVQPVGHGPEPPLEEGPRAIARQKRAKPRPRKAIRRKRRKAT